ncbi:MAG: DUF3289 family protein [Phaeodactylibacter sp.]|nr:DUF3289 family protein [Phaeodactylibacter sp.]
MVGIRQDGVARTDTTEQTKIHLLAHDYDENSGNFTAFVYFEILDHFGLDKGDAVDWGNTPIVGKSFESWWHLQHKRGYTPFRTRVMMVFEIAGNVND